MHKIRIIGFFFENMLHFQFKIRLLLFTICTCAYTTGWTVRDRIPGGEKFSPVHTGPGAHPASCIMGTGSFPGVKCGLGVLLTTHPLLVPRSWKSRAIPLPTLWATPVLERGHFTFTFIYIYIYIYLHSTSHVVLILYIRTCWEVCYHKSYRRKMLCADA